MSAKVDLYNRAYGDYERDSYREVRLETYGEDFGQTSWVTTEESHEIPQLLKLTAASNVLEIGCGSGRYALFVAETTGCRIVGVDLNPEGIRNATALAQRQNLSSQASFQQADVSQPLPFADGTFDAVYSNDVLCHIPGRLALLRELYRVLKPDGRFLFSDALVIGGMLSNEELAIRSSIGYYLFVPRGENEKLIEAAGFELASVTDTTDKAAAVAKRWHDAREKRESELITLEEEANFHGLQKFLACVKNLTGEKRLLRLVYLARKAGASSS
ncbi:MAG: methyltransferase domain-containing protein [Terriglobales bacterium]